MSDCRSAIYPSSPQLFLCCNNPFRSSLSMAHGYMVITCNYSQTTASSSLSQFKYWRRFSILGHAQTNKYIYIYTHFYIYILGYVCMYVCMYVYIYIYIYHLHIPSHTNGGCYTHNTPWPRLAKSQVLNFGTATRLSKENRSVGKVSKEASATKFSTSRYKAY